MSEEEITDKVILTVNSQDKHIDYDRLGLSFDSSNEEVLEAVRPVVQEIFNEDIKDTDGSWLFKTRKAENNKNIYVIPNLTAGN